MSDKTVEFASHLLHIAISAFMPYKDIKVFPVGFAVDDCDFISSDNLRLCKPYPNKHYCAIQQKPSYRGRNENGLLFLIPHPKTDTIKVTVLWGWEYLEHSNTAIQEIEFTIKNFNQNQLISANTVITTDTNHNNIMIFTRKDLESEGVGKMLKSIDTCADFWCWDEELGTRGDFVRHIKQKSTLELIPMSDFAKREKRPYVFQCHLD